MKGKKINITIKYIEKYKKREKRHIKKEAAFPFISAGKSNFYEL